MLDHGNCTKGRQGNKSFRPAAESSRLPRPADFLGVRLFHRNQDVSDHAHALAQCFRGDWSAFVEDGTGQRLTDTLEAFRQWALQADESQLAADLERAARLIRECLDSPLDLDEKVRDVLWNAVRPVLEELDFSCSFGPTPSTEPGTDLGQYVVGVEAMRAVSRHASELSIAEGVLRDIDTRSRDGSPLTELVDDIRDVSRSLHTHCAALRTSVGSLRTTPITRLFTMLGLTARQAARRWGVGAQVALSDHEVDVDQRQIVALESGLRRWITLNIGERKESESNARFWFGCFSERDHTRVVLYHDRGRSDPLEENEVVREIQSLSTSEPSRSLSQPLADCLYNLRLALDSPEEAVQMRGDPGLSSTLTLKIPIHLSTATVNGLLVQDSDQQFVLPLEDIHSITSVTPAAMRSVAGSPMIVLGGQPYRAVSLAAAMDGDQTARKDSGEQVAVLLRCHLGELCVLVNQALGQQEFVVSDLDPTLSRGEEVAGAVILSRGKLALLVRVSALIAADGSR